MHIEEEIARKERLEYYRRWRATHPESVRRSNRRYWITRAEKKRKAEQEANNG